jgi:hypothetical protein
MCNQIFYTRSGSESAVNINEVACLTEVCYEGSKLLLGRHELSVSLGPERSILEDISGPGSGYFVRIYGTAGLSSEIVSRNIQKLEWVVLSCSTAIVIQHATEAALALDRSIAKS